jgi:hypothetical protein
VQLARTIIHSAFCRSLESKLPDPSNSLIVQRRIRNFDNLKKYHAGRIDPTALISHVRFGSTKLVAGCFANILIDEAPLHQYWTFHALA